MKVEVFINDSMNGVEIQFPTVTPDLYVIGILAKEGFKLKRDKSLWYATKTKSTIDFANKLKQAIETNSVFQEFKLMPSFKPSPEHINFTKFTIVLISLSGKDGKSIVTEDYIVFESQKPVAKAIAFLFAKNTYGDRFLEVDAAPKKLVGPARELMMKGKIIESTDGNKISPVNSGEHSNLSAYIGKRYLNPEGSEILIEDADSEKKELEILNDSRIKSHLSFESFQEQIANQSLTEVPHFTDDKRDGILEELAIRYEKIEDESWAKNYRSKKGVEPKKDENFDADFKILEKNERIYAIKKGQLFNPVDPELLTREDVIAGIDVAYKNPVSEYVPEELIQSQLELHNNFRKLIAKAGITPEDFRGVAMVGTIWDKYQSATISYGLLARIGSQSLRVEKNYANADPAKVKKAINDFQEKVADAKKLALEVEKLINKNNQGRSLPEESLDQLPSVTQNPTNSIQEKIEEASNSKDHAETAKYLDTLFHDIQEGRYFSMLPFSLLQANQRGVRGEMIKLGWKNYHELFYAPEFTENVSGNLWDLIPEEYKATPKITALNWQPNPTSEGLQKIVANFVGKDALHPEFMGVFFDKEGIVASDRYKFLFLQQPNLKEKGLYCMTKECWKNIHVHNTSGKLTKVDAQKIEDFRSKTSFPNYENIIPTEFQYSYKVEAFKLLEYCNALEKIRIHSEDESVLVLKANQLYVGFNPSFLKDTISALVHIGYQEVEVGINGTDQPLVIAPLEKLAKSSKLKTDFALLMPIIFEEKYSSKGTLHFDLESQTPETVGSSPQSCECETKQSNDMQSLIQVVNQVVDELSDISIDLEDEAETIVAGTRFELEDALQISDSNELSSKLYEIISDFMDWKDELHPDLLSQILDSLNKISQHPVLNSKADGNPETTSQASDTDPSFKQLKSAVEKVIWKLDNLESYADERNIPFFRHVKEQLSQILKTEVPNEFQVKLDQIIQYFFRRNQRMPMGTDFGDSKKYMDELIHALDESRTEAERQERIKELIDEMNQPFNKSISVPYSIVTADKYIPFILVPSNARELFTNSSYIDKKKKSLIKNEFEHLFEVNAENLSESPAVDLFCLIRLTHPDEYGLHVNRSSLIEEINNRGIQLLEELEYPTDLTYPYVNRHTGYFSVDSIEEIIYRFESKSPSWVSVIENYHPIQNLDLAIGFIKTEIEAIKMKMKELVNPNNGKPYGRHKEDYREWFYKQQNLESSFDKIKAYKDQLNTPKESINPPVAYETWLLSQQNNDDFYSKLNFGSFLGWFKSIYPDAREESAYAGWDGYGLHIMWNFLVHHVNGMFFKWADQNATVSPKDLKKETFTNWFQKEFPELESHLDIFWKQVEEDIQRYVEFSEKPGNKTVIEKLKKSLEVSQQPKDIGTNQIDTLRLEYSEEDFVKYGDIGFDKLSQYNKSAVSKAKKVMHEAIKLGYAIPHDYGRGKGKYTTTSKANKLDSETLFRLVYRNIHIDQLGKDPLTTLNQIKRVACNTVIGKLTDLLEHQDGEDEKIISSAIHDINDMLKLDELAFRVNYSTLIKKHVEGEKNFSDKAFSPKHAFNAFVEILVIANDYFKNQGLYLTDTYKSDIGLYDIVEWQESLGTQNGFILNMDKDVAEVTSSWSSSIKIPLKQLTLISKQADCTEKFGTNFSELEELKIYGYLGWPLESLKRDISNLNTGHKIRIAEALLLKFLAQYNAELDLDRTQVIIKNPDKEEKYRHLAKRIVMLFNQGGRLDKKKAKCFQPENLIIQGRFQTISKSGIFQCSDGVRWVLISKSEAFQLWNDGAQVYGLNLGTEQDFEINSKHDFDQHQHFGIEYACAEYLDQVVAHMHDFFIDEKRATKSNIEKLASELGVPNLGAMWEAVELSWLLWYKMLYHTTIPFETRLDAMIYFWDKIQPTYAYSDSSKEIYKQYSTSCPIAAMVSEYTGMRFAEKIFEPSAGNGLLVLGADPRKTHVNEIDPTRKGSLEFQGFKTITSLNAAQPFPEEMTNTFDVVVTNPPFAKWDEDKYDKEEMIRKYFNNHNGLSKFLRLEHVMSGLALRTMKDNGKAAIIIGGHVYFGHDGLIAKYRPFFNWLYRHYNIDDVINLNSFKLYNKQGAVEKTMLILVNGRKSTPSGVAPNQEDAAHLYDMVNSFEELWERIKSHIGYNIKTLITQLKIELN